MPPPHSRIDWIKRDAYLAGLDAGRSERADPSKLQRWDMDEDGGSYQTENGDWVRWDDVVALSAPATPAEPPATVAAEATGEVARPLVDGFVEGMRDMLHVIRDQPADSTEYQAAMSTLEEAIDILIERQKPGGAEAGPLAERIRGR